MATLYLTEQGSTLRKKAGQFLISTPTTEATIPIREIDRILVFGNIQLTTPAISTCLQHHKPVVFLSQSGSYKGHLWSAECEDVNVEAVQFQRYTDQQFQLKTARSIVRGKLQNSKQLLLRLNRKRHIERVSVLAAGISADMLALEKADNLDSLRGYEGVSSARYFQALGHLIINPSFEFSNRNRRPPKDPINSLLSFGYTLLFNNIVSLILAEGLNPYLGNLHRSERKEMQLAFDLMEEFRSPIIDTLVLKLINKNSLTPTDFQNESQTGGVYLIDTARRNFIQKVEERLCEQVSYPGTSQPISYRRVMQLQAQHYKLCLKNNLHYQPFLRAS